MIGAKRTLASVFVSLLLVATAVISTWLMASAGVFTVEGALPSAPGPSATTLPGSALADSLSINSGFQVSQPRDPFEPLVTSTTTPGDGSPTTTVPPGGSTTTTQPGATTTTTVDDDPDGIRVALLEVRLEGSSRVAVVEVDGQTFTVGVGDTFATSFKVVSLTDTGGVFTYGDSAFTLSVGQSILK